MNQVYSFRRIYFETVSALHAGSGESDPIQDMPIQVDANGLPAIGATSIAGVLRHLYEQTENDDLFGGQTNGSRISFTAAAILDENGTPVVGIAETISGYLEQVGRVWRRDHCALNHLGTAKKNSKFDRSVLIAGVRFVTEFCISGKSVDQVKKEADALTAIFQRADFRLGGGTRNGFGRIRVLKISGQEYDLNLPDNRSAFLKRSSSLAADSGEPELPLTEHALRGATEISITLEPDSFWLFSDGTGFKDLDIRPKLESRVRWNDNAPEIVPTILLPATSVKGALAHRTAYHYNRLCGRYADNLNPDEMKQIGGSNEAVETLFGWAKDSRDSDSRKAQGSIGRVIISDIYCTEDVRSKVFNHVAIDRFTGGALDGALFTEEALFGGKLDLNIIILPAEVDEKPEIMQAFNLALEDLKNGRLPLGGGVMRGLGTMHEFNRNEV